MEQNPNFVNTNDKFYFRPGGIFHALYHYKLSDKYENVLKGVCWNNAYLVIGLEDKYVGNFLNNTTHIFIMEMHVGIVDMHTLYP